MVILTFAVFVIPGAALGGCVHLVSCNAVLMTFLAKTS
jgi:hypothetical protein